MGVDIIGIIKNIGSLEKSARIIARMTEDQKLRQKSQSKSLEISFGPRKIILSRKPTFPINKIPKAAIKATYMA